VPEKSTLCGTRTNDCPAFIVQIYARGQRDTGRNVMPIFLEKSKERIKRGRKTLAGPFRDGLLVGTLRRSDAI